MTAPIVEAPAQFERDLRSANKEWKRGKDSNAKWLYGTKTQEKGWYPRYDAEEDASFKARPLGKASDL